MQEVVHSLCHNFGSLSKAFVWYLQSDSGVFYFSATYCQSAFAYLWTYDRPSKLAHYHNLSP
jgi:hypothetical protein